MDVGYWVGLSRYDVKQLVQHVIIEMGSGFVFLLTLQRENKINKWSHFCRVGVCLYLFKNINTHAEVIINHRCNVSMYKMGNWRNL